MSDPILERLDEILAHHSDRCGCYADPLLEAAVRHLLADACVDYVKGHGLAHVRSIVGAIRARFGNGKKKS